MKQKNQKNVVNSQMHGNSCAIISQSHLESLEMRKRGLLFKILRQCNLSPTSMPGEGKGWLRAVSNTNDSHLCKSKRDRHKKEWKDF